MNLTKREREVAGLIEQGMRNKQIGTAMGIRPGTVKIHLRNIFLKTGCTNRYELALAGLREKGIISAPTATAETPVDRLGSACGLLAGQNKRSGI